MFTVSCIGTGPRGIIYMKEMVKMGQDKFKIISLCDKNIERLKMAQNIFNIPDENCYLNEDDFFKNNKADVCIVSTQDQDHVRHAIKAMESGSDVLCEKPISNKESEVRKLLEVQQKLNKKVMICHVLRFAPAFVAVKKMLEEGVIGRLITIDNIENVGYMHQAHSYVRGNWRRDDETSPMIIAKCCHDLDLFVWFINSECESVSSIGDLRYFKKENQPEGASDRCVSCKYRGSCVYDAYDIYIKRHFWGKDMVSNVRPLTDEVIAKALEKGPYGRCVFACDNNVVDNEITMLKFKNGVTANLRMIAFTYLGGRIMKFYGTHGQIDLDETQGIIKVMRFGQPVEEKPISSLVDALSGHGGGDTGLINGLYDYLMNNNKNATSLSASVESHLMGFAAEESRINNGKVISIKH